MTPQALPWCEPLDLAQAIDDEQMVLLYSGVRTNYSGRYSLLAHDINSHIRAEHFDSFEQALSDDKEPFENAWFGYLAYGLKDVLEKLQPDEDGWLELPKLNMMRFNTIYQFDHENKTVTLWSRKPATPITPAYRTAELPSVSQLSSNMTGAEYLARATNIIERIHAGDLYQANLTRKFSGEFVNEVEGFSVFKKLCATSPAPFSAYIRDGDTHIISSSPESFLTVDADGKITTRPIKGTAPRSSNEGEDKKNAQILAHSKKDQSENLMIVDLMRNDLARSAIAGSVKTEKLFEVTTHATIHHMSSTISAQKRPEISTLDVVKYAFPPGSMTGAPKIHAMNLCSELEKNERGIYSGAIGWFAGDGSSDLSVVIRTIILQGKKFEFQVGGGIVADSTPSGELKELIDKSKGILLTLRLKPQDLAAL